MSEIRLEPLEAALQQLKVGVEMAQKDQANELLRDGVIQRFEYTMDLCWKLLQRYLKDVAQVDEFTLRTKKDLFREGAKRGLLQDAEAWILYYEARNQTSHGYDRRSAQAVYEKAAVFHDDAALLLKELRR